MVDKDAQLNDDVFSILRDGTQDFSSQQKLLCTYILENYQDVVFYTVEKLAKVSQTSPATVVRTVKSLGYKSYKSFLDEIRKSMTSNRSVWWELQKIWDGEDEDDAIEPVLSWVSRDDISGIRKTLTHQLMDSFDTAVQMIEKAKKIGLIGLRSSKYVAGFMNFMLNQMFNNSHLLAPTGVDTVYDELLNYNSDDLIIAISLGGPHFVVLTQEIVSYAHENQIPVILITSDISNPAINHANLTLCVGNTEYHYSIVQPIVLVEALITELGRRHKDSARTKIHKLETVLEKKHVTLQ